MITRRSTAGFGADGATGSAIADSDGGIAAGVAACFSAPKFMRRNTFSAALSPDSAGQCSLGAGVATCDSIAAPCLAGFGAV
jgi:hypothetical protein